MADLYDLERRYRAAHRDLGEASDRLCDARDYLARHPVNARAVQEYELARTITNRLYDQYVDAQERLDSIDRRVDNAVRSAELLRRQLERRRFLTSPAGVGLLCSGEVALALLLSLFCLASLPIGVWAILLLVFAFGLCSVTILVASAYSRSDQPRRDYLAEEIAAAEEAAAAEGPQRDKAALAVDGFRDKWGKADKVLQELKAEIRPKVRFDRATEEYQEVLDYYNRIRGKYEAAQADRRLRLLERRWAHLKDREFELFIQEVFDCLGYLTELTPKTGDQGIDVIAEKRGVRWGDPV